VPSTGPEVGELASLVYQGRRGQNVMSPPLIKPFFSPYMSFGGTDVDAEVFVCPDALCLENC
jgi:hypothetical protein